MYITYFYITIYLFLSNCLPLSETRFNKNQSCHNSATALVYCTVVCAVPMSITLQSMYHSQVGLIKKLSQYSVFSHSSKEGKLYNINDTIHERLIYHNNELVIGYVRCVLHNTRKSYNGIHLNKLLLLPRYRNLLSEITNKSDQLCVALMQEAHQHDIYIDLDVAGEDQMLFDAFLQLGYTCTSDAKILHRHQ